MIWAAYFAIASLLAIGIYGVMTKKNLIKIFISISIMETGVNLMLIAIGYIPGGTAPIENGNFAKYVDPLPQALVLTAIVIGVSVLALALVMVINYYQKNKTLEYRRLMKW